MLAQHSIGRNIFLSSLGGILLIAFISYWIQFEPLSGSNGLLPVADYMHLAKTNGNYSFLKLPTLSWFSSSDWLVHLQCFIGVLCSLLLILRKWSKLSLLICWFLYLSLVIVGQVFYNFQWDILLLETTLCSIFLMFGYAQKRRVPQAGLWLLWLLLFKLMFLSGVVKLTSGDSSWWDGTALTYHYFSQPLPNPLSYYFHHLPSGLHKLSCWIMFFIELVVPFLIIIGGLAKYFKNSLQIGRGLHLFTAFSTILLMLIIFVSGNYNYFNLLVIALCFLLIDNQQWQRLLRREKKPQELASIGVTFKVVVGLCVALILSFSAWQTKNAIKGYPRLGPSAQKIVSQVNAFRSINSYGLFRVMTRTRPEIIFEGSNDKVNWRAYELRFKINALEKAPPLIAPHQPRFEWQMWFAALGTIQYNQWVYTFMKRILEGSEQHEAMLRKNPFPNEAPKYMRAVMYHYEFSEDGSALWKRGESKPYSIELGLSDYPE